jgi:hypothetical protein
MRDEVPSLLDECRSTARAVTLDDRGQGVLDEVRANLAVVYGAAEAAERVGRAGQHGRVARLNNKPVEKA